MVLAAVVIGSILLGFMAGLLSVRKAHTFCETHGITKTCSICRGVVVQQSLARR